MINYYHELVPKIAEVRALLNEVSCGPKAIKWVNYWKKSREKIMNLKKI